MPRGSDGASSVYSTVAGAPARSDKLVDFDILNSGRTRYSVGAVEIKTEIFTYFDNISTKAQGANHVMASGALPPGFPPVVIDGKAYWDGGLVVEHAAAIRAGDDRSALGHVHFPGRSFQRRATGNRNPWTA